MSARVGLIVPSSNTVMESEVVRLGRAASVHVTRIRVTEISLASGALAQFGTGPMTAAASLLGDAQVDAVAWAGTAGAWLSVEHDRRLAAAMSAAAGVPATTSTLAMLDTLRARGVSRIGLITPYVAPVVELITATFAAVGITVTGESHLGLTENYAFAAVGPDTLAAMGAECAVGAQALVVFCTNVAGGPAAARMSAAAGLPVLDSIEVTLDAVEALARRPDLGRTDLIGEPCGS
jgi:maleate isomerase